MEDSATGSVTNPRGDNKTINSAPGNKEINGRRAAQLRVQLCSLLQEKENTFRQLRGQRSALRALGDAISALKKSRDSLTLQVKELKAQRDSFNKDMKEAAGRLQVLNLEKQKLLAQHKTTGIKAGIKGRPPRLRQDIAELEQRLETEVLPFGQEQAMRKWVKELKLRAAELAHLEEVWQKATQASRELTRSRREAGGLHHRVQETAAQSQQKHEEIKAKLEELKKLRTKIKPLEIRHSEGVSQAAGLRRELEDIERSLEERARAKREQRQKEQEALAEARGREVQEKLRQRKKLTTEDILAFQAGKDRKESS